MAKSPKPPKDSPQRLQDTLAKTTVSIGLRREIEKVDAERDLAAKTKRKRRGKAASLQNELEPSAPTPTKNYDVVIELNRSFPGGIGFARLLLLTAYGTVSQNIDRISRERLKSLTASSPQPNIETNGLASVFQSDDFIDVRKSLWTDNYVFGCLSETTIGRLASFKMQSPASAVGSGADSFPLLYKIWLDHPLERCVFVSARTIKCDAAQVSFSANGKGIVWAVADTGIDGDHPHFKTFDTLSLPEGLMHKDFTQAYDDEASSQKASLVDTDGHGTHVAGIIAGMTCLKGSVPQANSDVEKILVTTERYDEATQSTVKEPKPNEGPISGLAPYCKLMSLKVLGSQSSGKASSLLAAIGYIQRINDNGRHILIHGLNLSLGFPLDAEWFAAGQSPLCAEIDLLVRSGVCVVVAAGNAGYGVVTASNGRAEQAAHLATICDPGNAALAITVGSTHRDMPHSYGISYFSAKGPTSDGRMKPDLVAPGERIVSCALYDETSKQEKVAPFKVDSGTSMAAPHVSGAAAAFLSVRGEFIGRPEDLRAILVGAATDLKRRPEFQGGGLIDLMRALQSV